MGGLVNYFTLWSHLPSEDWPGLQVRSSLKNDKDKDKPRAKTETKTNKGQRQRQKLGF